MPFSSNAFLLGIQQPRFSRNRIELLRTTINVGQDSLRLRNRNTEGTLAEKERDADQVGISSAHHFRDVVELWACPRTECSNALFL
jgi:hypothetical protein